MRVLVISILFLISHVLSAIDVNFDALIRSNNLLSKHSEIQRNQKDKITKIINVYNLFAKKLHSAPISDQEILLSVVYHTDGDAESRGIFISKEHIFIMTKKQDCLNMQLFNRKEISKDGQNILNKIIENNKKNEKLYKNYNGDFSRFGRDTTIALFFCKYGNKRNKFLVDCIGVNSSKIDLIQINEMYNLILKMYKLLNPNSIPLSGA